MLVRNTRSSDPTTRKRPREAWALLKRIDGSGHCHRSSLDLDAFDAISTLESLRAFIPELGSRIKTFAASSSNRYRDPNSFRLARTHARTHTPTRTNLAHPHPHARPHSHACARTSALTHPLTLWSVHGAGGAYEVTSSCMHMCRLLNDRTTFAAPRALFTSFAIDGPGQLEAA